MFVDLQVGSLSEPLTGRHWDRRSVEREWAYRVSLFRGHGLVPGDRVFLHYGNCCEFFVDLLAIWSLGGCAIPIDPRLTAFEVGNLARAAAPRFSLWRASCETSMAAALSSLGVRLLETASPIRPGIDISAPSAAGSRVALDQPALILFTSGTTGEPKGVVHTHRSLRARWVSLLQSLGTKKFKRTLCLLPTHFGHGLICNCLFPWLSGQDLFIVPPFKPDLIMQLGTLLDEHAITSMSSVPLVWRIALRTARPPQRRSLERVFCGSAPLSACLWRGIQEWTRAGEVFNAYGITETGSWMAGTTAKEAVPEDGLIGLPWGSVIKVLRSSTTDEPLDLQSQCAKGELGHVWLNTPGLMQGYLGRDDLTRRVVSQGWFHTGDIGVVDERGLFYLRGRERDEINKGGTKVYPGDIDMVAEQFEQTLDVCTFAYEDPVYGENIGIALVLQSADDDSLRRLHDLLKQHLATFQMPQRWYLLHEIPRTSRGKVNRSRVSQICGSLDPLDLWRVIRDAAEAVAS